MHIIHGAALAPAHIEWLKTHAPQGTHFIDTAKYAIPDARQLSPTHLRSLPPSALLHLIHDIYTQLTWAATHPSQPSAPAFFTPEDIIQLTPILTHPTHPHFMISPEKFLPIITANTQPQHIRLCNIPPASLRPHIPPEITKIPANIPPQTAYHSLGHIAETFTQWDTMPLDIADKMRRFIARACAPDPAQRQLLWE
jgi:hypothetical protein